MEFTDLELACLWHRLNMADKLFSDHYNDFMSTYDDKFSSFPLWGKIGNECMKRNLIRDESGIPNMFKLRSSRKKMTQEEVEKELGYKIEIVNK